MHNMNGMVRPLLRGQGPQKVDERSLCPATAQPDNEVANIRAVQFARRRLRSGTHWL